MKVAELISLLQEFDSEMEVKFSYNYGDYWKTHVAQDIEEVSERLVKYSRYHDMDALADEYEDPSDDVRNVVVIS